MLDYSYNPSLVLASLAIVLMSGFTGLSLTQGASKLEPGRRKLVVAMSAVALGGGIWSMHFVAMLGLRLPILYYYDALTTLISALVAVLITGLALLFVHFGTRTPFRITLAGGLVGLGVPAMHYIGMSGMQLCRPVYSAGGIALALGCSLVLCVLSFWLCYGQRRARNIILGTLGFGLAVFAVHFIAMGGTGFVQVAGDTPSPLGLSNEVLAFGVTLASFVIAGAFLLTGVTFRTSAPVDPALSLPESAPDPVAAQADAAPVRVPFERDGRIHFVASAEIAAIRAEGRYTYLYSGEDRLFCPWSISEVETRLQDHGFYRCHRSYVVNADHVSSFERKKDTGVLYFDRVGSLDKAPVSRSYLPGIRNSLGL